MIWAIAVVFGLLVGLPFLAELARRPMSAARQSKAPGEIAALPQGATHYRWSGRAGDPVAVCIHGLSTPSYMFAATERSLVGLGYRVLSYDLYGRGYSARVRGAQGLGFHIAQLRGLLAVLEVDAPKMVLGFSMGGQIAAGFAAREDRVEKLVLVAPTGLAEEKPEGAWIMPVLGGWLTLIFGGIALRRELVEHKTIATVIPDFEDRQAAETRMRGYLPALLSSRRHLLQQGSERDHRRVAALGTPVLAIWGTADPVIPRRSIAALAALNPEARHVEIKDAGHTLLQSHPSEVAAALTDFLKD